MKNLAFYETNFKLFSAVNDAGIGHGSIVSAQQPANIREQHKVKKKETVFGISRAYGLTIEELINANPEMKQQGYELKKGAVLNIPYPKSVIEKQEAERAAKAKKAAEEAASRLTMYEIGRSVWE